MADEFGVSSALLQSSTAALSVSPHRRLTRSQGSVERQTGKRSVGESDAGIIQQKRYKDGSCGSAVGQRIANSTPKKRIHLESGEIKLKSRKSSLTKRLELENRKCSGSEHASVLPKTTSCKPTNKRRSAFESPVHLHKTQSANRQGVRKTRDAAEAAAFKAVNQLVSRKRTYEDMYLDSKATVQRLSNSLKKFRKLNGVQRRQSRRLIQDLMEKLHANEQQTHVLRQANVALNDDLQVALTQQNALQKSVDELKNTKADGETVGEQTISASSAECSATNVVTIQSTFFETTLACPICADLFIEPVAASHCGHVFCRYCIERWSTSRLECPVCRQPVLRSNHIPVVQDVLEKFVDSMSDEAKKERAANVEDRKNAPIENDGSDAESSAWEDLGEFWDVNNHDRADENAALAFLVNHNNFVAFHAQAPAIIGQVVQNNNFRLEYDSDDVESQFGRYFDSSEPLSPASTILVDERNDADDEAGDDDDSASVVFVSARRRQDTPIPPLMASPYREFVDYSADSVEDNEAAGHYLDAEDYFSHPHSMASSVLRPRHEAAWWNEDEADTDEHHRQAGVDSNRANGSHVDRNWRSTSVPQSSQESFSGQRAPEQFSPYFAAADVERQSAHSSHYYGSADRTYYAAVTPTYSPEAPVYSPESPAYSPDSPVNVPESPDYSVESPDYVYSPQTPSFAALSNRSLSPVEGFRSHASWYRVNASPLEDRSRSPTIWNRDAPVRSPQLSQNGESFHYSPYSPTSSASLLSYHSVYSPLCESDDDEAFSPTPAFSPVEYSAVETENDRVPNHDTRSNAFTYYSDPDDDGPSTSSGSSGQGSARRQQLNMARMSEQRRDRSRSPILRWLSASPEHRDARRRCAASFERRF